jgi:hypothetical protein
MEYIILIIPILLSMPHVLDTYFFKYRIYGYKINKTDYGYSLHIRYSTLARGFYFLGLPIVGLIFNIVSFNEFINFFLTYHFCIFLILFLIFIKNLKYLRINLFFFCCYIHSLLLIMAVSLINICAFLFKDYQAAIFQTYAAITGFGSILHIFIIDKEITLSKDYNEVKNKIELLSLARTFAAFTSLIIFIIIKFYIIF